MLRLLAMLLLAAVFVAGAALGYFNSNVVQFNYLFGTADVQLVLLIVASFVFAMLLTLVLCGARILSLSGETRRLRKQLREADTELKNLRNLPLHPQAPSQIK